MSNIPKAECRFGYPVQQLENILGNRITEFYKWMHGQTFSSCDGRLYNYETEAYEASNCGPHGFVYYQGDVERFLDNRPIVD
jgi:hypothetical protein